MRTGTLFFCGKAKKIGRQLDRPQVAGYFIVDLFNNISKEVDFCLQLAFVK
jgi:hypothetical protein